MNIKVITRHAPSNYGSLLQSIATIIAIERLGHTCSIIDYVRKDERGLKELRTSIRHKKDWNANFIKKFIYLAVRFPEALLAQHRFDKMRAKYLHLTSRCNSQSDLAMLDADVFMTGSDQVWGPVITGCYDSAYFLSFVSKNRKKVSYAASFGHTDFNDKVTDEYRNLLSSYNEITVREDSAVKLLEEMGTSCLSQVLDPTLLLTGEEWTKYILKEISGKYVLVYQLHNNQILSDYALNFAKKKNLPLIRISPTLHQFNRGGRFVYLPDLGTFLSYIKNCTYFITDSFHGTAFAITFNKQFLEILPNNKTGSRNQSILRLTNLENRIVTDYNDYSITDEEIDYDKVNSVLLVERKKSFDVLKTLCSK